MGKIASVKALIESDEGRRNSAYEDSLGYLTIGVGHLIDKRLGGGLPDFILDALLEHDLALHHLELSQDHPWTAMLNPPRRAALISMHFNLGRKGFNAFTKTLDFIQTGDYVGASFEMLKSRWARQVPKRAKRASTIIRHGEWPSD